MADDVERVLADVDADHGNLGACCLGHGRAPRDAAPAQRRSLAGQEHGRTIPLPDKARRLGRIGLATRLAMCDFTISLTPEEKAEQALWENLTPVGREFGRI